MHAEWMPKNSAEPATLHPSNQSESLRSGIGQKPVQQGSDRRRRSRPNRRARDDRPGRAWTSNANVRRVLPVRLLQWTFRLSDRITIALQHVDRVGIEPTANQVSRTHGPAVSASRLCGIPGPQCNHHAIAGRNDFIERGIVERLALAHVQQSRRASLSSGSPKGEFPAPRKPFVSPGWSSKEESGAVADCVHRRNGSIWGSVTEELGKLRRYAVMPPLRAKATSKWQCHASYYGSNPPAVTRSHQSFTDRASSRIIRPNHLGRCRLEIVRLSAGLSLCRFRRR